MNRIVFLHGFTQRGAIWDVVLDDVRRRLKSEAAGDWQIFNPDLPGHGDTPISANETFWQTAQTLASRYGPAHWVGYSLGARLLLHIAIAHTQAVQSMTLVGAKMGFADRGEAQKRVIADDAIALQLDALNNREEFDDWLQNTWLAAPIFHGLQPATTQPDRRQIDVRLTNDPHALAISLRTHGSGLQEYLQPLLADAHIQVPTTVLWGEHDSELVVSDCKSIVDVLPNAFGNQVSSVGHSIPWEAPDIFADFVVRTVCRDRTG